MDQNLLAVEALTVWLPDPAPSVGSPGGGGDLLSYFHRVSRLVDWPSREQLYPKSYHSVCPGEQRVLSNQI